MIYEIAHQQRHPTFILLMQDREAIPKDDWSRLAAAAHLADTPVATP
jgi:hypothetical protein